MDFNGLAFRIIAAIGLFFLVQLFYFFSKIQTLDDGKLTLEAEVQTLERKRDDLRMKIYDSEREIHRATLRLQQLEVNVRDRLNLLGPSTANQPIIYFITPTHFRPAQRADLIRLSQTLAQVPNLHWIIVEDAGSTSNTIANIIRRTKLPFTHLNVKTKDDQKMRYTDPNWKLPRGVDQRNAALAWIRKQFSSLHRGVVYFGDDDNVYDWQLFSEMRSVRRAAIWPVGIVGGLIVETPIVHDNGTVIGFNAVWKPERPFPIDMAAFAVNLTLVIQNNNAGFSYDVPRGYQESHFLESLQLKASDFEPKGDMCTKVYVWHTRTEKTKFEKEFQKKILNFEEADFSPVEAHALGIEL